MVLTLSTLIGVNSVAPVTQAQGQKQALVISSLEQQLPMGQYAKSINYYLTKVGYNVTFIADGAVTIDFLLNNLNSYSIILWRTNTFIWVHRTYWYVGEKTNTVTEQKYASDFSSGWLLDKAGIIGMTADFVINHFGPKSLAGVKLLILMASNGNAIAPQLITAGITTIIYCNGIISLQYGLIDDLTTQMLAYLTQGQTVNAAVQATVSPFNQGETPTSNIDTTYAPPFWFLGDDSLTIT
jgi:hypothetical protein